MNAAQTTTLTAATDVLTQLEYARDDDHARSLFADLDRAVLAIREAWADTMALEPAADPVDECAALAARLGLVRDRHATDCWSVAETGANRVWRHGLDDWHVFEYPLTYPTELEALRAYAKSRGVE